MCPQLTKQYSTFEFFHRSLIFVCLLSAELVPLLLESGASLEARNKDKATPLDSSHNKQVIFDSAYLHTVAFFLFRERSGAGGVTWPLLIIWWLKFVCAFEFITFQNSHYIIPLRFNFVIGRSPRYSLKHKLQPAKNKNTQRYLIQRKE